MKPPDNLPPLPPVPEGFDRWEYRGEAWRKDSVVCAWTRPQPSGCDWVINGDPDANGVPGFHYLEAVREPAAPSAQLFATLDPQNSEDHLASGEATGVESRVYESPTPSRYRWTHEGVTFDFYRLCEILGITSHAQAHALKKVIRAGRGGKTLIQDIDEAIDAMRRFREMATEDAPPEGGKP